MNEQDESLDSGRESSAFWLAIVTAGSKAAVPGVLLVHEVSEKDFINRFPALAEIAQSLPDVPGETSPPI
ncbi:hypothetical protein ACFYYB_37100 [Streptomyces sp. NPDC002886]|uniref:hypothetical protein n=1 Tax=Streptomyces sp. NPDC002886 TaxID=3364667 RepID=UPI003681C924